MTIFDQRKFSDVFGSYEEFEDEYANNRLFDVLDADHREKLYYLLYGRYGGSTISAYDETQFKYALAGIVYSYGGTWVAKDKIQIKLRTLVDNPEELLTGTTNIVNRASNPGTAPTTNTTEELQYLDDQNVTKIKYGKLSAYGNLYSILVNDVTEGFLSKFSRLFKTNLADYNAPLYVTDTSEEE